MKNALLLVFLSTVCYAAPRKVVITVTPSPTATSSITRYNIYKTRISGQYTLGQPYATVFAGPTPDSPVIYIDPAMVNNGNPAYYRATSVCPTCATVESDFSNEIRLP